ncbi:MAG: creatininase [Anaerolineaceae bacterium]|nr:creatininase [Anaerolineaceae bacterium]
MKQPSLWMDMTWPELKQAVQENRILFFVVGAVEQHGPALPTSVDVLLPMTIAQRVAGLVGGVLAPCTNYGYKSLLRAGGGPHFVGSVGLRGTTVIALVSDIMTQFIQQGWRRIVVLDWHLENVPFVFEGVDEALRAAGQVPGLKVIKIDNPNGLGVAAQPGLEKELFGDDFPGWVVEHAAIWETSAMLAAHADLVRPDKIVDGRPPEPLDYDVLPVPPQAAPESGVFWKATRASREKGEKILSAVTEGMLAVIHKEFGI